VTLSPLNLAKRGGEVDMSALWYLWTVSDTQLGWKIYLSDDFNTTYYIRAGISWGAATSGSSSPPSGIISERYATSGHDDNAVPIDGDGPIYDREPSTEYCFYAFAQAANGLYYPIEGQKCATTDSSPAPPIPQFTSSSSTTSSISLNWSTSSGATEYHLQNTWGSMNIYTPNTYHTYTELPSGTSYTFRVRARASSGGQWSGWSDTLTISTSSPTPTNVTNLSGTAQSTSQINFSWTHATVYEGYNLYINSSYVGWTTNNYYNATGLSPGLPYTLTVKSTHSGAESSGVSVTVYTQMDGWNWSVAAQNAFDKQTGSKVSDVTWGEWNNFIDKILQYREFKDRTNYVVRGGSNVPIVDAKMTSGNRTLTALRFNIARQAIGEMNSTGLSDFSSGQEVKGSYFNTITDSLNGIT